ncbi:unnamed protein product [Lepeophtheirus salmonis]|uniref:(salmon louse) hypothetical protein n=1 Tax=Lepeophtheirus salmonis TaxID=72036 RepID=A0A7R8CBV4_LEPSM|nr:unnamed protein product [Lepeophtheirus salmonis]CAF2762929.1 unnamed protein product [Lepeophtheirus salmonis]
MNSSSLSLDHGADWTLDLSPSINLHSSATKSNFRSLTSKDSIKDLSSIAAPLHELTRQSVGFTWMDEAKVPLLPSRPFYCNFSCFALRHTMFDYTIINVKGIHNLLEDTLSRGPLDDPEPIIIPDATDELMCLGISSAGSNDNESLAAVKHLFALT